MLLSYWRVVSVRRSVSSVLNVVTDRLGFSPDSPSILLLTDDVLDGIVGRLVLVSGSCLGSA